MKGVADTFKGNENYIFRKWVVNTDASNVNP